MSTLRAQALLAARVSYAGVMGDAGRVLAYSETQDALGTPKATYTPGESTPCLFSPVTARQTFRPDATISVTVAKLRLPLGIHVTRRDRFEVTQRFGVDLDEPLTFAVTGVRGTLAFTSVDLSEVTT